MKNHAEKAFFYDRNNNRVQENDYVSNGNDIFIIQHLPLTTEIPLYTDCEYHYFKCTVSDIKENKFFELNFALNTKTILGVLDKNDPKITYEFFKND